MCRKVKHFLHIALVLCNLPLIPFETTQLANSNIFRIFVCLDQSVCGKHKSLRKKHIFKI